MTDLDPQAAQQQDLVQQLWARVEQLDHGTRLLAAQLDRVAAFVETVAQRVDESTARSWDQVAVVRRLGTLEDRVTELLGSRESHGPEQR